MRINLAKSSGFCFGVKRALQIAAETARTHKRVFMLGDIVHNEEVVKKITRSGIKKIGRLAKGNGNVLLIRAHGACRTTLEKAAQLGYKIVDATCPMVKEIHKIAREMESSGYTIIIIGDKKHDEVHGITGQLKRRAIVIDDLKGLTRKTLKGINRACVVVQSTQDLEKVNRIVMLLKTFIPDLRFFNTICKPTRAKQEEIRKMPRKNDVILVIGSKTSANTRRLYEIARALNRRSYWVESNKEIKPEWFKNAKSVGVTAGASTPEHITKEIIKQLKDLKPSR